MKKKMGLFSVFLLVAVLALAACGNSSTDGDKPDKEAGSGSDTYEFKFAHAAAETHPLHWGSVKFAELVEEKSDGRMKITIFPARQLGDEREGLENVINGTTDMGLVSTPIISAYSPLFDALQLPFLLNTYELEEQAVGLDVVQEMIESLNDSVGIRGLGVLEGGMRHIGNNKRTVNTPADLKGLKLRTVESPLILDIFNELGASPTPMAYGEVYTSLETGVIDGEEINLTSMIAEKHAEVLKHFTVSGQFPFPTLILVNSAVFDGLSEEDQKIIQEAGEEATAYLFDEMTKFDEEALETIKEMGVEVTELQDVETFKSETDGIYEEYMAKDPLIEKFVKEVQNLK